MKNYNKEWYNKLNKSKLTPPKYLFGIVWPILYLLLAIFFIFSYRNKEYKSLIFFVIQLVLNLSWTTFFFRLKMLKTSLILIVSIIILSILSIIYLKKKKISYLLIPYIIWLILACYLNLYIVVNN